ncbi:MAG TPA: hypothetical protein PLQ32_05770 [Flavihumibacter sp.]|nr:hypothetical protein [Flavihumibacter sp.]
MRLPVTCFSFCLPAIIALLGFLPAVAQVDTLVKAKPDSVIFVDQKAITLKEVVVRNNMDVPSFIRRIQVDTSFYRAFKNLRELNYTALNDITMFGKDGAPIAGLHSRTRQLYANGCRSMETSEENITGNMRDENGNWNYYTAEMYAGLFFTKGRVCGEDNSVKAEELNTRGKRGLEKHKEQLKMLFFNPGRNIPGIPFIGDKINIYEPPQSDLYDFDIDMTSYQGQNAYTFRIQARPDLSRAQKNDIVINSVITYFDLHDMKILARTYDLSYDAGVYDFNVQMDVEMFRVGELLLPKLIRYSGNWKVALKKREKGIFTATIFDVSQ